MYTVLLVDDEPLILSGIKFMIDWQEQDLELIGTARNGRQALDMIAKLSPDIVVADIKMPVMDGIELIQKANDLDFPPVFIMLTNLQEFDLVRDAMKFSAADYLIKSQLEPGVLQKSLQIAKEECRKRNDLARATQADHYLRSNKNRMLEEAAARVFSREEVPSGTVQILKSNAMLVDYTAVQLQFLYPTHRDSSGFSQADKKRLFDWERELIQKLAQNSFENFVMISPLPLRQGLLLFAWGLNRARYEERLSAFWQKVSSISRNVTGMDLCLLTSDVFSGEQELPQCQQQIFALRRYYYCYGGEFIHHSEIPEFKNKPLALEGLPGRLKVEINRRNAATCVAMVDYGINRVQSMPHEKAQALWLCSQLYSAASAAFQNGGENSGIDSYFTHTSAAYHAIECLATRKEVLHWLATFKNELASRLAPSCSDHVQMLEKARQYVYDNVEKRILLQDVAEHVCISPGYLSTLFKKQYGQNFVDFINQTKINSACKYIRESAGKYRISEIAYKLSFDNAYYFSKVFRRYTGITPSEYKHKVRAKEDNKDV